MSRPSQIEAAFVSWRMPGLQDDAKRSRLRKACPSQRRTEELDSRIARQVLSDPALYTRVLNLTAATHEARN